MKNNHKVSIACIIFVFVLSLTPIFAVAEDPGTPNPMVDRQNRELDQRILSSDPNQVSEEHREFVKEQQDKARTREIMREIGMDEAATYDEPEAVIQK
jgi:hypothetical protein